MGTPTKELCQFIFVKMIMVRKGIFKYIYIYYIYFNVFDNISVYIFLILVEELRNFTPMNNVFLGGNKSTLWRQQHTASPVLYGLLGHVCGRMNDVAWTWSDYFTAGMYPPGDLVCGYSSFGARGLPPCKLIRRPFLLAPACGSLRLQLDGAPQSRPPHLVGPCQWLGRGLLLGSDSETTCVVGWPPVHCRTGRLAMMASKQDPNESRCPWRWSTQPLDPNGWHPAGKSWLCVLLTCMGELKARPASRRSAWPNAMILRASVFFGAS